jgi:hypothetical protein
MFKGFKSKLAVVFAMFAAFATMGNALILSDEQRSALVTSLSGAYSEYMALLIAVVTVSAAFYLIANFAGKLGRGRV